VQHNRAATRSGFTVTPYRLIASLCCGASSRLFNGYASGSAGGGSTRTISGARGISVLLFSASLRVGYRQAHDDPVHF
jgi:hypothetical protein